MTRMSKQRIAELLSERSALLGEICELGAAIRGSVFERFSTCSRPKCACHRGRRHGPRTYLTVGGSNGQRQHYVPKSQVKAAHKAVRRYRRLRQIVEMITRINLELLRGEVLDQADERDVSSDPGQAHRPGTRHA